MGRTIPTKESVGNIDLRQIFLGLQSQMVAQFRAVKKLIKHPVSKGDAAELQWLKLLEEYLPQRYRVAKAFVIDCQGNLSDQIDIVIYDQQYSPLLFSQDGTRYVPAESVYAVFEVKPTLNKANVAYAGLKAASVRRLHRSSAPIPHAGGTYKPKKPPRIVAGLLSLEAAGALKGRRNLSAVLGRLPPDEQLDLGCALESSSFAARYSKTGVKVETSSADTALIFFFLRFLARLQAMGTVVALDFNQYSGVL